MYLLKIRFVESSNGARVFVKNDDNGCWSAAGHQGTLQELNLAGKSRSGKGAKKAFTTKGSLPIRAGPQSKNWSDQQNTLDPTGSVHKKARGKKFDPKKVDFDEGDCT